MKRFIESAARDQVALLPECLDDYVDVENPVRVVDVFVDELDLVGLGFERASPSLIGRPAYHPSTLLKLYIYGYLNRIQSSRRLEREAQRNLELIWLTGRLTPDFKTIADFRKDNGVAIRKVCREFVLLWRRLKLFSDATVAIDGSKFKAVNNRDKNFTERKLQARMARDAIGQKKLTALADRGYYRSDEILRCEQEGIKTLVPKPLTSNSKAEGRFDKRDFVYIESDDEYRCPAGERAIWRFTTIEAGLKIHKYWPSACPSCKLKPQCTPSPYRRVARWEHEKVLEDMQRRLDQNPDAARLRRQTVEHPFGTLKFWMGSAHFLMKTLPRVRTEMSLHVLAYNLKRAISILGTQSLIDAMKT
jgi:transposase